MNQPSAPVHNIVEAVAVDEYNYKVEMIDQKIYINVLHTPSKQIFQLSIYEGSDIWISIKDKCQNNLSLCYQILSKALLQKEPQFRITIHHTTKSIILELIYHHEMLWDFTIKLELQEAKQREMNRIENQNKLLMKQLQDMKQEINELKRIIDICGPVLCCVPGGDKSVAISRDKYVPPDIGRGGIYGDRHGDRHGDRRGNDRDYCREQWNGTPNCREQWNGTPNVLSKYHQMWDTFKKTFNINL